MKALLLDVDGIVLKKQGYFSEHFAKEYNVPLEKVATFFKNEFRSCQRGGADLKAELPKYLSEWGWAGSVDDFLAYWFKSDTVPDDEVFDIVSHLRKDGVKCYLASNQERYRAEHILRELDLENSLDGFFFSYQLKVSKSESEYFKKVITKLGIAASEITFFDNEQKNIDSAKSMGIQAYLYTGINDLKQLK